MVTWSALRCGASGESGKKVAAAPLSKTAAAAAAAKTWFAKHLLDYMLHNRFLWKRSGRRSSMWPPYSLRNLSAAACRPCDRSLMRKASPCHDDIIMGFVSSQYMSSALKNLGCLCLSTCSPLNGNAVDITITFQRFPISVLLGRLGTTRHSINRWMPPQFYSKIIEYIECLSLKHIDAWKWPTAFLQDDPYIKSHSIQSFSQWPLFTHPTNNSSPLSHVICRGWSDNKPLSESMIP